MAHATLDPNGNVTGVFANPQPGSTQAIPDNDPRITAFQMSLLPPYNGPNAAAVQAV